MKVCWVSCPICIKNRHKTGTRTAKITYHEKFANIRCFHEGQCELNKDRHIAHEVADKLIEESGQVARNMDISPVLPIPSDVDIPPYRGIGYEYRNVDGELLWIQVRHDKKTGKYFQSLCYTSEGWEWAYPTGLKCLFGAENIKKYPNAKIVVVEGEKAVLSLNSRVNMEEFIAVSAPNGAGGVSKGDWKLLKGREVIIWPDADEAGIKAMEKVRELLYENSED